MKITASILILLLFAMAFAPCGDASEMDAPQQVEQVSNTSTTGAADFQYQTKKAAGRGVFPHLPLPVLPVHHQ